MARGDQFVVNKLFRRAEMAGKAALAALDEITHIEHAEFFDRALVRPVFDGVLAQPARRRAVAAFATHSIADVEGLSALLGRNRKGVTGQTARGLGGRMLKPEDFANADRNGIGQHLIGAGVFVLARPDAVFILWNPSDGLRLNAAVAAAGRASASSVVLAYDGIRTAHANGSGQEKPSDADCGSLSRPLHPWGPSIVESICLYPFAAVKAMKSVVLRGFEREPCAISIKRFVPRYDSGLGENPACLKSCAKSSTSMDICRWSSCSCSRGRFNFR